MKCYDCETKLTKQEEEFGLCGVCEGKRSKKQGEDYQKEQASKEMSKTNNADWHKEFSSRGGSAKTEKKTAACRRNAKKPRTKAYKEGDTVKYIGKGFIRFDPSVVEMKILEIERYDLVVEYKGEKLLVRNCEVSPL